MDVCLLGPIEARLDGRPIALGARKQRAVLAMLALRVERTVSTDRLAEGLWGDELPPSAAKMVQLYVSQLRRLLADGAEIVTRGRGYELRLGGGEVDAVRFERLIADARPREALALWRGAPLSDVADEPFAAVEVRRLEELRLRGAERAIDADLAEGRHAEVLDEIEALLVTDPLHEGLHTRRMLVLYRAGRQSDALGAYRHARTALITETGVEPGPLLRRLHEAILRQDVSLDPPATERGIVAGQITAGQAPGLGTCPYKGLASFEVEDRAFFAGRERLVSELVARLTGASLLGIVGASGSGKSSVLRAGLLAALAEGVLPGSERWKPTLLRPGEHPLRTLGQAELAGPDRQVLLIDQFEELFTACDDEEERKRFVAAIVTHACDPRRTVLIVIALRADFYGPCAAYPELARLLADNHVLVGPLRRDELRRAIEVPALHAGLEVERDLVDVLVSSLDGRPGALPLLSTSLLELWQRRDGQTLRLADHERAGGVEGAVARLAERAYARLDSGQRVLARGLLLRLAGEAEGEATVRRRVSLAELAGTDVAGVLAPLAESRLITIGDGEAEIAHEALLREWPRLRDWLEEDAEARRLHQHLIRAARDWDAAGRDPSELYRGTRLVAALDWRTGHEPELNQREREFLAASRTAAGSENARRRRADRRVRTLLAGVAALLCVSVVAGAVALVQRGQARRAALKADAQRIGAEAVSRDRLDQALLLARSGVALDDSAITRGHMLSVLMRSPQTLGTLPADAAPLYYAAVSPDGRRVAIAGSSDVVTVLDATTRRPAGRPYRLGAGLVLDVQFSPDGRTLAVTGLDVSAAGSGGIVDLVDVRTHQRRRRIDLPAFRDPARWLGVNVAFTGRDIVVHQVHEPYDDEVGPASVLRRFDGTTGAAKGPSRRVGRHATVQLWRTGDGSRLFVTSLQDGETTMLDAGRLRILKRWPVGDITGAVDAGGSLFALGSDGGAVRLLDLRSGRVRRFAGRHDASVLRMRFTGDAQTLVTSGADGELIVWDVAAGAIRQRLSGHARGTVWGLALSPDGRTAYSAGEDKRAFAWDLTGDRSLVRPFTARPFVPDGDTLPRGLAISPDGRTLAVGRSDGMVDLVDARTLRGRGSVRALAGFVSALAFSPDGRQLAATGQHGRIALFDARTLRPDGELLGQHTTSQTLAFSRDGALLVAAEMGSQGGELGYSGGSVRVWDMRRRAPTGVRVAMSSPSVAFSPDGSLIAMAPGTRFAEVHDAQTGRLVATLRTPEDTRSVAFSPDGRLLATGHFDGTAQLWSTERWEPIGRPLEGHDDNRVLWTGFTHDGTMLATAGQDGTIELLDVATQAHLGVPLIVEPESYLAAVLSPDGRSLFAVSADRAAFRWNIDPAAWNQQACSVAGRALSAQEWRDAVPGRPYRAACRAG